jgi:ADP-ribosylglycohydrolase
MASQTERWSGCILGLALGDALGAPVEGKSPAACTEYVHKKLGGPAPGPARTGDDTQAASPSSPVFGQYTDDTQLARELLLSYAERGRFDPAHYAQRIGALFGAGAVVGAGRMTEEVGLRLHAGVPWEQAGLPVPAAGNSAAVRAAPLGLLFGDDVDGLIRAAREQARITNYDPRCAAGAAAVAGAVALLLRQGERGEPLRVEPFLAELAEWVRRLDQSLAFDVYQLSSWVTLSPEAAATFLVKAGLCPGQGDEWAGVSSYVLPSVLWSLYSFLRAPEDVHEALRCAIAVGGDVDTTAAMAGAMLGAYHGRGALPAEWTALLNDQGRFGEAELIELTERCYRLRHGSR